VQTSFLGDVVLTTPLLAELAARGPVDVVVTPAAAPLLATHPDVRTVFTYDKKGHPFAPATLWRLARSIRLAQARAGDPGSPIAYLAQGSVRSALLALLVGCHERIGFATSGGRYLYTRRVPYRENAHHAARLLSLAEAPRSTGSADELSASSSGPRVLLYPAPSDVAAVDALLGRAGAAGSPLIAIAPGSVWGTKRWPHYPALAAALARDGRIVLVGSAADTEIARQVAAAVGAGRAIDATGQLTLLGSAELIRRAAVLITNDSAPQHLASAMGTPTVTLFGPTVPGFGFGPLAPRHAIAEVTNLPCRPCDRHGPRRCPLGHWRCMRDLSVEHVAALVRQVTAPTVSVPL
jgi:heptosyltransferase-2